MPDNPYDALFPPANPRDRVHGIASRAGIDPDIADDYLRTTKVESGHNVNVRNSSKGAIGFGQVMPDIKGGTTRTVGGRSYNLKDPDQNIEAGLRYFAEGGRDPVARRLHYFGGAGARRRYERTGRIPNISDGNLTAAQYVQATGGAQQQPSNPYDALFSGQIPAAKTESKSRQEPPSSPATPASAQSVPYNALFEEGASPDTQAQQSAAPPQPPPSRTETRLKPLSQLVIPPGQQDVGLDYMPKFGGGQPYREWNPRAAEAHEKPGGMVMGEFRRREVRDAKIAREIRPQVVKDYFGMGAGVRQDLPPEVIEQQIAADPRVRDYIESETQRRAQVLEERENQVSRVERGIAPPLGVADKIRQLRDKPEQLVPFLSSIPEINNLVEIGRSAEKLNKGEDLTTEEQVRLREFIAASKQDKTLLYQVADVVSALPAFAAEFALTGGIYSAGRKAAVKGLEKLITKEGIAFAEKKLAGRIATKVATGLVGAAAQTLPAGATRIPAGVIYRRQEGQEFGEALRDTLLDQFIEVASERAGGLLSEIPLPKRLAAIRDAVTTRWINKVPGRTAEQLQKLVEKTGWHGPLGEILEERVGDAARYAPGLQDSPVPTLQQLAVEGLAFSVPGVAARVATRAMKAPRPIEPSADVVDNAQEPPITLPENGTRPIRAEAPETIHAQIEALVNARGSRYAVLIPKDQSAPTKIPKGYMTTRTNEGVVIHAKEYSSDDVREIVNRGDSWQLLGHMNADTPEATRILIARAGIEGQGGIKPGTELLSSYVIPGQEQNAIEEMRAQFAPYEPTFEVGGAETAANVDEERAAPLTEYRYEGEIVSAEPLTEGDEALLRKEGDDPANFVRVMRGGRPHLIDKSVLSPVSETPASQPETERPRSAPGAIAVPETETTPPVTKPSRFVDLSNEELEQYIENTRTQMEKRIATAAEPLPKGTPRARRQERPAIIERQRRRAHERITAAQLELDTRRAGRDNVPSFEQYLETEAGGTAGGVRPETLSDSERAASQKQYDALFYPKPHHSAQQRRRRRGARKGQFAPGKVEVPAQAAPLPLGATPEPAEGKLFATEPIAPAEPSTPTERSPVEQTRRDLTVERQNALTSAAEILNKEHFSRKGDPVSTESVLQRHLERANDVRSELLSRITDEGERKTLATEFPAYTAEDVAKSGTSVATQSAEQERAQQVNVDKTADTETVLKPSVARRSAPKLNTATDSLEVAIRSLGGVRDDGSGEVKALKESGPRGLVSSEGRSAHDMAMALAEHGYGRGVWWEGSLRQGDSSFSGVNANDFIAAAIEDASGSKKHYSNAVEQDVSAEEEKYWRSQMGPKELEQWEASQKFLNSRRAQRLLKEITDGTATKKTIRQLKKLGKRYGLENDVLDEQIRLAESAAQSAVEGNRAVSDQSEQAAATEGRPLTGEYVDESGTLRSETGEVLFSRIRDVPRSVWATLRRWIHIGQHRVKREGNVIVIGEEAAAALYVGDEQMSLGWLGEFNTATEARARLARTAEGTRIRPDPKTQPRMIEDLEKIRSAIQAALDEGYSSVVVALPQAARHEAFHASSFSHGGETLLAARHKDLRVLTETPEYAIAARALLPLYLTNDPKILVEEIAARLADGKYKEVDLTREQAIDWMAKWFKSFGDTHGNVTLEQFKELANEAQHALATAINQAAAEKTSGSTDKDVRGVSEGRERGATEGRAPPTKGQRAYPLADRGEWYSNADYKARGGHIVEMSPDEFLAAAKPLEVDESSRDNIDDLKRHIESGRTLDPAALYADGKTDGRHRAIAAKELGIQSIPVIDFRKPTNQTDSPEFKRWFGESKVVDDDGKPLVVYRGDQEPWIKYDPRKLTHEKQGIYLTTSEPHAKRFGEDRPSAAPSAVTRGFYVRVENPLEYDGEAKAWEFWQEEEPDFDGTGKEAQTRFQEFVADRGGAYGVLNDDTYNFDLFMHDLTAEAKSNGYDGVIIDFGQLPTTPDSTAPMGKVIVVFEPTQIKSATGNRGTFDPNDPNILFSRRSKDIEKPKGTALDRLKAFAESRGQTVREFKPREAIAEKSVSDATQKEAKPKLTVVPPPQRRAEPQTAERSFPKSAEAMGYRGGTDRDYTVLTDAESIEKAQREIVRVGADRAAVDLAHAEDVGAPEIATGILLMQHYEKKGDISRAVSVAGDVARKLTKAGQTVQAASLISRLSPEGVLLHAQKILKGKELSEETGRLLITQAKAVSDAEKLIAEIQKQRPDIFGPNGEILPRPRESRRTAPRTTRARIGTLQDRLVTLEQQARERMQARAATAKSETATLPSKGQRGAGLNPVTAAADLGDLVIIGAAKLARKGITQAEWLAEMAKEASALTRKDLRKLYRESYETYQRERKQFLRESRERGAVRHAAATGEPAPVTSRDYDRIIADRLDAQTAARKARAELAKTFEDLNKGRVIRTLETARDVWNLSRSLITSLDLSAAGRQGKKGLVTHPRAWLRGVGRQFKALSTKQYERMISEMQLDADYKYAQRFKLKLSSIAGTEEVFQNQYADKVPWVKQSQQAYDTMLDTLRFGWFKAMLQKYRTAGVNLDDLALKEQLTRDASLINNFTGRGGGKTLDKIGPTLSIFYFSPRFWAANLKVLSMPLDPRMYGIGQNAYSKQARVDAWKTLFGFYGLVAVQIGIAKMLGAAVSFNPDDDDFIFNPDSPDFLKVRFGNTHIDFSAGLQTHLRVAARLAKALYMREFQQGKPRKGPVDILSQYSRGKESPGTSLIHDLFFSNKKETEHGTVGTNFAGQPVFLLGEPGKGKLKRIQSSALTRQIAPIIVQDALEAYTEEFSAKETALGIAASVVGEGANMYKPRYSESREKWPMQAELDRLQITVNAPQRLKPGKYDSFKAETEEEYEARRQKEAAAIKEALGRLEGMGFFRTLPDRSKEAAIRATITAARESVRYQQPAQQRKQQSASTP